MRQRVPLALLCALLLIFTTAAWAVEMSTGEKVSYGKDKPIDDDLLTAGNQVTVDSAVKGDLTAAGSNVTVSGPITGSALIAGAIVNVSGEVGNDAWLAGSQVTLSTPVRDNAYLAGSTVTVTGGSKVGKDLLIGGAAVDVLGDVGRDLRVGANSVTIGGKIGRNAHLRAANIKLTPSAVINGNLYYPRNARADIAKGATIRGQTIKTAPIGEHKRHPGLWSRSLCWFGWLLASIVFGLVLVSLFPVRTQQTAEAIRTQPWASLGIGFVAFIVAPIAAIIFMFTVIGIPLGIALLLIYPVLLFCGYIMAAVLIGKLVLQKYRPSVTALLAYVALGLLILSIINAIPILGGLVVFLAMLIGFGALLISWWQNRQPRMAGEAPSPTSPASREAE